MISKVSINNFKSIKDLKLDCKKINLFIGKPNVGKSNILEGLSIFNIKNLSHVRIESARNLFYDQDINHPILIKLDDLIHYTDYNTTKNIYNNYILEPKGKKQNIESLKKLVQKFSTIQNTLDFSKKENSEINIKFNFGENCEFKGQSSVNRSFQFPNIKKYVFNKNKSHQNGNIQKSVGGILRFPYGENIFEILRNNGELLKEVSGIFKAYGYSLIIDFVTNKAEIQKVVENVSYKIPYSLIADTLQRIVFYKTAIRTNSNCAILLEEPENHSFPPYIRDIAFEIINSSNQFFIATHSPYLLNTLMSESKKEDLAIHIVTYSEYQTKVKTLSETELSDLSNYGIDIFFNLDMFAE